MGVLFYFYSRKIEKDYLLDVRHGSFAVRSLQPRRLKSAQDGPPGRKEMFSTGDSDGADLLASLRRFAGVAAVHA